jgi:hypothetical protein
MPNFTNLPPFTEDGDFRHRNAARQLREVRVSAEILAFHPLEISSSDRDQYTPQTRSLGATTVTSAR